MNELWRVQGATGAVRMMSLDDIDRAFHAGWLTARTYVLAPGSMRWQTLGEAAGLDEIEQTPSLSPVAIATGAPSYQLPAIPQQRPVSFDDDDLSSPQPKSRKPIFLGLFGAIAAACAFAVFAGSGRKTVAQRPNVATAAAVALPPAAETKLPAPADQPKAEPRAGLTDEQKKALLDADKAKAKKSKGKRRLERTQDEADVAQPIPKAEPKLVESGDKFDPLNSSL